MNTYLLTQLKFCIYKKLKECMFSYVIFLNDKIVSQEKECIQSCFGSFLQLTLFLTAKVGLAARSVLDMSIFVRPFIYFTFLSFYKFQIVRKTLRIKECTNLLTLRLVCFISIKHLFSDYLVDLKKKKDKQEAIVFCQF